MSAVCPQTRPARLSAPEKHRGPPCSPVTSWVWPRGGSGRGSVDGTVGTCSLPGGCRWKVRTCPAVLLDLGSRDHAPLTPMEGRDRCPVPSPAARPFWLLSSLCTHTFVKRRGVFPAVVLVRACPPFPAGTPMATKAGPAARDDQWRSGCCRSPGEGTNVPGAWGRQGGPSKVTGSGSLKDGGSRDDLARLPARCPQN